MFKKQDSYMVLSYLPIRYLLINYKGEKSNFVVNKPGGHDSY